MADSITHLQRDTELVNESNGNRYKVVRALGQGGFGIVYAAWDVKNEKQVAIKEYFPGNIVTRLRDFHTVTVTDANDEEFFYRQKEQFFKEARNMQRFKTDKNIVNVIDYFEANGTAYIVMEFIDGQTFMQTLKKLPDKRMSLQSALANLKPIFDVLDRIHNTPWIDDNNQCHTGLVHRDISPENIMFPYNGPVKLLDFGAARNTTPHGTVGLTQTFKEGYAPLEQYYGSGKKGAQGPWTDIYALAATIYRAITGKRPPDSMMRERNGVQLPRPSEMGVDITPEQENALLKGLALDYNERYHSAKEFFKALNGEQDPPSEKPSAVYWIVFYIGAIINVIDIFGDFVNILSSNFNTFDKVFALLFIFDFLIVAVCFVYFYDLMRNFRKKQPKWLKNTKQRKKALLLVCCVMAVGHLWLFFGAGIVPTVGGSIEHILLILGLWCGKHYLDSSES